MSFPALIFKRWISFLFLLVILALCGCRAPDDNPRPWNSPEGWQGGSVGTFIGPR